MEKKKRFERGMALYKSPHPRPMHPHAPPSCRPGKQRWVTHTIPSNSNPQPHEHRGPTRGDCLRTSEDMSPLADELHAVRPFTGGDVGVLMGMVNGAALGRRHWACALGEGGWKRVSERLLLLMVMVRARAATLKMMRELSNTKPQVQAASSSRTTSY